MGWASSYIKELKDGHTVFFRPRGRSMAGRVEDGDLVTVEPMPFSQDPKPGDIVLCRVGGNEYLHLVKSVGSDGRFMIGNNKGRNNGWTTRHNIFGICTRVEP